MSNVIDFLERMGQDANLRQATDDEMEKALTNANIAPALRAAIFSKDDSQLEVLLGATTNVCCIVAPVSDEEDEEGGDQDKGRDAPSNYSKKFRRLASVV